MERFHLICMLVISKINNFSTIEQTLDYIDSKRYSQTREEYLSDKWKYMFYLYNTGMWYYQCPLVDKYFHDDRLYTLDQSFKY